MGTHTQQDESLKLMLAAIGKQLKELRLQKGYTSHADFAIDHKFSPIQYWRMENGKSNITLKSLHRITSVHGITVQQFMTSLGETHSVSTSKAKRDAGK